MFSFLNFYKKGYFKFNSFIAIFNNLNNILLKFMAQLNKKNIRFIYRIINISIKFIVNKLYLVKILVFNSFDNFDFYFVFKSKLFNFKIKSKLKNGKTLKINLFFQILK